MHAAERVRQWRARIELCRKDGSALRTVMIDECTGAPHEFRGVYRGGLLRALQAAVPADRVRYGAPVQGLQQDDEGEWSILGRTLRVHVRTQQFPHSMHSTCRDTKSLGCTQV